MSERILFLLTAPSLLCGCASVPTPITSYRLPTAPQGIVLVVDGAGGYQVAPRAVIAAARDAGLPLFVRSFDWTLGKNLGVADMTDTANARAQGQRLAEEITAYRTGNPNTPVYLVAHSAGAMVTLESTRWLTPGSVERIILLAPAVSADYDLRQALRVSRMGLDVFSSKRDRFFLGLGVSLVGTADGKLGAPAAGRVGFDATDRCESDAVLFSRLRQYAWSQSDTWNGNFGGHAGTLRRPFLKAKVLPLLGPPPQ